MNLFHLQKRLEQSGKWPCKEELTLQTLKELLFERFSQIDFESARQDVLPFISDSSKLDLWQKDFFWSYNQKLWIG